ncbi:MAG TPA: hypothetical protein DDX20_01545 [Stenotrophomonas sp.]|nr:hypothetical protein [Stenotrophomonas sp.]
MSITEDDLLGYAKSLAEQGADECQLRASMSRSYYAAFHALLPLVELLPPSAKARGREVTHVEVTERLVEWKVDDVCVELSSFRDIKARAQRAMDTARSKRVIADYRLGNDVNHSDAMGQIHRVEQVIRAAKTLVGVVEAGGNAATG